MAAELPCFDGLLDSTQPRDTLVTIVEEGSATAATHDDTGQAHKRQRTAGNNLTLQAHWVVLWSLSPFFRAKLERWSEDQGGAGPHQPQQLSRDQDHQHPCKPSKRGFWSFTKYFTAKAQGPDHQQQQQQQQPPSPPYQYRLQLLVPPGQLELGRRLITAMYSSSPDLSDLEAPQLMQLLQLAECYGVGKVVAAVGSHFNLEAMSLQTAAALLGTPDACIASEAFSKVRQAAADKLQQELGDLEVAWGDEGKQQQLLKLPLGALLQLLRDERTRVASEDTVVYTAQRWLSSNPAPTFEQHKQQQQQQQLAGVLRPPHCLATFLASLAGRCTLFDRDCAWVYDSSPGLLVDLLAFAATDMDHWKHHVKCVYPNKASWQLPPRPESAVTQLQLCWDLPLGELQQLFEEAQQPDKPPSCAYADSAYQVWWGRDWRLSLSLEAGDTGAQFFLHCRYGPAYVDGVYGAAPMKGHPKTESWRIANGRYVTSLGFGGPLLEWGAGKEWPQVAAWLQQQGLVHPDGCLHLRATITNVY